jgi:GNAT superfamily N-acetyltransferase
VPEIDVFVAAYERLHSVRREPRVEQGIYALDAVVPAATPLGSARAATMADRPLLVRWWGAFGLEALGALEQDEEQNARSVDHRLTTPGNGIALWEVDGDPVSLVSYGSPTPAGIRIGPVYTPAEHRGRGYASALTAHVSAEQLAAGRDFCFLYTDLANPTSNKIYVAIGYRRVADAIQYAFV